MFLPHMTYAYSYPPPYVYRSLLFARTPHESLLKRSHPHRIFLTNLSLQGKVAELRAELLQGGGKKDKNNMSKKIALKKIVANMTMSNNDMVALFPDIVVVMDVQSLEIKKM